MLSNEGFPDALPTPYRLHWYALERVLGQGGFGITYLAMDTNLGRPVAIKEYLPADMAQRRTDASVRPRTAALAERFRWGKERFIVEAQTLARFDHPNVVRVLAVFEANETAYMVMRFEEGQDLAQLLQQRGTLSEAELLATVLPVLDGLEAIHTAGFIHRDIKPQNIHIRRDGSPVLLDFGSARQPQEHGQMTVLVARGYAPLEQYYSDPQAQGPWTDIYGLAATCYHAITGAPPLDALERIKGSGLGALGDTLEPALQRGRGRYSEPLLRAIDHGLQAQSTDRPRSIAQWRGELRSAGSAPAPRAAGSGATGAAIAEPAAGTQRPRLRRKLWRMQLGWSLAGGVVAAVGMGVFQSLSHAPAPSVTVATLGATTATPPPMAATAVQPVPAAPAQQTPVTPAATLAPEVPTHAQPARPPQPTALSGAKPVPGAAPALAVNAATRPAIPAAGSANRAATAGAGPATAALVDVPAAVLPSAPAETADANAANAVPSANAAQPASAGTTQRLDEAESDLRSGAYARALRTIEPLAHAAEPRAQQLLGQAYEAGRGLPQSAFAAYMWYSLAARSGNAAATAARERMAQKLQAVEILQADRSVAAWKPERSAGAAAH